MRLGYNTNGLAHHRLLDAIDLLADEGYASVAITLDAGALDPYEEPAILARQVQQVRAALDRRGLGRVIETGCALPPQSAPQARPDPDGSRPVASRAAGRLPAAVDRPGRRPRGRGGLILVRTAPEPVEEDEGLARLAEALKPVLGHAERADMPLAFEPEPGMFIDTLERFARLDERVRHPLFDLTIDVGHVHCSAEGDIAGLLRRWRTRIRNIHIEDMVQGVHEHLMFGQGTMEFPPIFRALHEISYQGAVHVELSRHSHMAVEAVRASAAFLKPMMEIPSR